MNERLALDQLSTLLDWNDDQARQEFRALSSIATHKYDDYRDFIAGSRFLERLLIWLGQFEHVHERRAAYDFMRNRLIYISSMEMTKLIELFYYEEVKPYVLDRTAKEIGVQTPLIWTAEHGGSQFEKNKRRTLFMGLSEGARTELLRYVANGELSNEQIVATTQVDVDKWRDLIDELKEDLSDPDATFHTLYAMDDFTGSGTTLIRKVEGKGWKGKLIKLKNSISAAEDYLGRPILEPGFQLRVHHYLSTAQAREAIDTRLQAASSDPPNDDWFQDIAVSYTLKLPKAVRLGEPDDSEFLDLVDSYYDPDIEVPVSKHLRESGISTLKRGYSDCALPLILHHNTPNNSVPLLWEESKGENGHHTMQPLFRRVQRHT